MLAERGAAGGISVMREMPWGTHFCYFHETKQDLLDASIAFFQAGIENHEFCLWIVYTPVTEADALEALREAVPDLDRRIAEGGMEIRVHSEPLFDAGQLEEHSSTRFLHQKLDDAMARGYAGMRVAGSPHCLQRADTKFFREFERDLGQSAVNHRIIALCHFPLAESSAAEIVDAARSHQFVITRRQGNWEIIEAPEIKLSKAEITRLNLELEQRVEERTRALAAANEELRSEIARREQVEADLRRQKEILQTIFDHIPVMINFGDGKNITLVNRQWEQTLGWSLEEINSLGIDIVKENYPDPEYRGKVLEFIANSQGEWADFKVTVRDGRVVDISWAMLYLSDGTGIGIGQDISTRKRAEEGLRESEERFRQLAENIQDLFWIKTPDFKRVLYLSPAFERMSGRSREDRYRDTHYQPLLDAIVPEDRERMAEIMGRGAIEEYDVDFRIRRPDGSVRWIRDRAFPIRDAAGTIYRVAGIAQDITERKLSEEALRESEERFRQLAENIREVFWLRSPDYRQLLYISPLFEKNCGKSPEQLSATGIDLDTVHPDDHAVVVKTLREHAGQEFELEYRMVTKDGEVRWIRDRGFPIRDASGQIYRMGGVAEDITERKEAEEQLKASSEQLRALSANLHSAREQESKRIADQVHDEVGGMLTGLRWELEALGKMIREPGDFAKLKAAMQNKLEGMLELTDSTINVVRGIASELRPSILDDLGLAEAMEWQVQQFQARTGIACSCQCSGETSDLDSAKSTALFRIMQEALTNILRHSQATCVKIALTRQTTKLVLTVADDGRGITEAEKSSRTSLGLLGMRERAHAIGGSMEILGAPRAGTTLEIHVPLGEAQPETIQPDEAI